MAPYPIIADIASESTTIAGEIAASPELRLDQRPVATWTLDDGTACLAYDGLAEHLAALDPIGPVICTGHLASVQADPEDEPVRTLIVDFVEHPTEHPAAEPEHGTPLPPGQQPQRRRVPPRPARRLGPPPPPPEYPRITDVDDEPTTVDAVLDGDPELVYTPAGVAFTTLFAHGGLMGMATGQLAEDLAEGLPGDCHATLTGHMATVQTDPEPPAWWDGIPEPRRMLVIDSFEHTEEHRAPEPGPRRPFSSH